MNQLTGVGQAPVNKTNQTLRVEWEGMKYVVGY